MKKLKVVLMDGRELQVEHKFTSTVAWLSNVRQGSYFSYSSTAGKWVVPYHAIVLVQEEESE